jgi:hypothetical protein
MRNFIVIIILAFTCPIFNLEAQRKHAFCYHSYCHEMPNYDDAFYYTPGILQLALNDTQANPNLRLNCPTENKTARKFYWRGYDSLKRSIQNRKFGTDRDFEGEQMRLAIIFFTGAIEKDSSFCDAYDNLIKGISKNPG